MRFRWGQAIFIFLVVWLLILLYLVFPLWRSSENEEKLVSTSKPIETRAELGPGIRAGSGFYYINQKPKPMHAWILG
jgi:hypothetical protein